MTEDSRNHKRRKSNDGVTAAIDQMSTFSINKSKIYTCSECLYPVVVGIGGATRAGKVCILRACKRVGVGCVCTCACACVVLPMRCNVVARRTFACILFMCNLTMFLSL